MRACFGLLLTVSALVYSLFNFGELAAHDLVPLNAINSHIQIDMRYAGCDNSFGFAIYPSSNCFLVHEVALKLSRVQSTLEDEGLGLKVFDAYRPYRLQAPFADPCEVLCGENGSEMYTLHDGCGHNRGTSVDVALICLENGDLDMGGKFGFYTDFSARDSYLPAHIYHNRNKLETVMRRYGFISSPGEWWHFDYCSCSLYPILDIPFEELCPVN